MLSNRSTYAPVVKSACGLLDVTSQQDQNDLWADGTPMLRFCVRVRPCVSKAQVVPIGLMPRLVPKGMGGILPNSQVLALIT